MYVLYSVHVYVCTYVAVFLYTTHTYVHTFCIPLYDTLCCRYVHMYVRMYVCSKYKVH